MRTAAYPIVIDLLSAEDGDGFLALVPDLPGCMSDGATREVAADAVDDATAAWIDEATALGWPMPTPSRHLEIA